MAARKDTISQRDFSLGVIRPEAEERDDTELVERSLKEAKNTISLSTGQCSVRPGSIVLSESNVEYAFEAVLGGGRTYELLIHSGGLSLRDDSDAVVFSRAVNWTALPGVYGAPSYDDLSFWALPDADSSTIVIGSQHLPMQMVWLNGSSWNFGQYDISSTPSGAANVPFWRHHRNARLRPSGRSGNITLTTDLGIWSSKHTGAVVRYADRQIRLGNRISATQIQGTVLEGLPPTFTLTVASSSGFLLGDAVEAKVSGGQGIVTGLAGNDITVLVTSNFTGFDINEDLIGPHAKSKITAKTDAPQLADTYLWDMQLWNAHHGYPGSAEWHGGRLLLCDFPSTPSTYASSAAQDIRDFKMGPNDGDGFVDTIMSGGVLHHIVSAEDLLFLTSKGLYYHGSRDGSALTPSSINPRKFSSRGASAVRPVAVDDGAIFVGVNGTQIHAAILSGDVYKSWRVQEISKYAPHLIKDPVRLGATATGADRPEMFVVATLADGTAAVAQWDREENSLSWRPWDTPGKYRAIYQSSGKLHALVDREIAGQTKRFRERFEYGVYVDCMSSLSVDAGNRAGAENVPAYGVKTKAAQHLSGHSASVYFEGFDMGDRSIRPDGWPDDDGQRLTYPDGNNGLAQIGLHFDLVVVPWSRRSVQTVRGNRDVKRLISMFLTIQSTGVYEVNGVLFGGYHVGEDLTKPPPLRSKEVKATILGAQHYKRVEITRSRPGPFTLLKIKQRVVV